MKRSTRKELAEETVAIVAKSFARHLRPDGPWASRFDRVVFSIHDASHGKETLAAFQRELG